MKTYLVLFLASFFISYQGFSKKWLRFCNQSGPEPHVFVQFIQQDEVSKQFLPIEAYGFNPEADWNIFYGKGTVSSNNNRPTTNLFTAEVTDEEFAKCIGTKDEWEKNGTYSIVLNNCIDFMRAIIANLKDIVPPLPETIYPSLFVKSLKQLNNPWDEHSVLSLEFANNQSKKLPVKANEEAASATFDYHPFKMRSELVSHGSDEKFNWFDWGKAPSEINTATTDIFVKRMQRVATLAHDLDSLVTNEIASVQVAAIDLDDNGVCGIVAKINYTSVQVTVHPLLICENGYLDNYYVNLPNSQDDPKPMDFVKLITKNSFFVGDRTKTLNFFKYDSSSSQNINISGLLGGSTPEELGIIMLKALKTNNKKLWASCVHPTYDAKEGPAARQEVIDQFDVIRSDFDELGLSNWNLTEFSRVTFDRCNSCAPPGEKWLIEMHVEFYYKNKEFLGQFGFTPVLTYKGGKYFIGHNYTRGMVRTLK